MGEGDHLVMMPATRGSVEGNAVERIIAEDRLCLLLQEEARTSTPASLVRHSVTNRGYLLRGRIVGIQDRHYKSERASP